MILKETCILMVMWQKMVGDFFISIYYNCVVNFKRKQALLESNLPAIKLMLNDKKGAEFFPAPFYFLSDSLMAKKTHLDVALRCKYHSTKFLRCSYVNPLCTLRFSFKCPKYESIPLVDFGMSLLVM